MIADVREEMVALLPRLRRFAFAQTRSVQDADDLVQSACERALMRLDQFKSGTRLDNWMFSIVRSIWIDSLRMKARRPEVIDTEFVEAAASIERASEQTEARSDLRSVSEAMMGLPEDQLNVLTLVVMDGRTYQETAELLQVPIGTVMSRLSRARAKLAASLEPRDQGSNIEKKAVGNDVAH